MCSLTLAVIKIVNPGKKGCENMGTKFPKGPDGPFETKPAGRRGFGVHLKVYIIER